MTTRKCPCCGGEMPDETSELEMLLTPLQFRLASILIKAKGRMISTSDVIWSVWEGDEPEDAENCVAVLVHKIKAKLGKEVIESGPWRGYRWAG